MTAIANVNLSAEIEPHVRRDSISPSRWAWWKWCGQAFALGSSLFYSFLILVSASIFLQWLGMQTELWFAENRTMYLTLFIAEFEVLFLAAGFLIYIQAYCAKWLNVLISASLLASGMVIVPARELDIWTTFLFLLTFALIMLGGWFAMKGTQIIQQRFPTKNPDTKQSDGNEQQTMLSRINKSLVTALKISMVFVVVVLVAYVLWKLGLVWLLDDINRLEYEGKQAPAVVYETAQGEPWRLSDQRGKVVLIDHWATWCGPCRAAIPEMKNLYEEYGHRDDFVMIGVSSDKDHDAAIEFCQKNQMEWTQLFPASPEITGSDKVAEIPVSGIPSISIIDRDGIVVGTNLRGAAVAKRLRAVMSELPAIIAKNPTNDAATVASRDSTSGN